MFSDKDVKKILANKYTLLIIIIIGYIFNFIVYRSKVITTMMVFVFVYLIYLYGGAEKLRDESFRTPTELREDFINEQTQKEIKIHADDNFFVDNIGLYSVYEKPDEFLFLNRDKFLQQVLYNLRFIKRYDKGDFFKLMVLMDKFLRIYYCLIIDRYEPRHFDHALDIRLEILNTLYNFHVDAPLYESRNRKPLTETIKKAVEDTQAYTFRKIKNLGNKFPDQKWKIKNPRALHSGLGNLHDRYQLVV